MRFLIFEKLGSLIDNSGAMLSHHLIAGHKLGVEITLNDPLLFMSLTGICLKNLQQELSGFSLSSHLPFYNLALAAKDLTIAEYSRAVLVAGLDASSRLGITRVVSHTTFFPLIPSSHREKWIPRFLDEKEFLEKEADSRGITIAWENTYEPDFTLFDRMLDHNPATKLCLDIGHAHCFSTFSPADFLARYRDNVVHLHIHDNKGDEDAHLPLGQGTIDIENVIRTSSLSPVTHAVFELSHDDMLASLPFVKSLLTYAEDCES